MLAVSLTMPLFSGCFMVNSQKMKRVKGTYKLTNYTYTPKYERKEGATPVTVDYIADRGYEVYLVVTGEDRGYYVHKDNETTAYSKEVSLTYEYDTEETSKIKFVSYQDSTEGKENQFGVTRDALNYSKPAFDYTELFTDKPMRSEDIRKDWKKVDSATDLSYVKEQLGELREYTYDGWANRGLYSISAYSLPDDTDALPEEEIPYLYYYVAIDGTTSMKATVYYALKSDSTPVQETKLITLVNGWSKIKIGDSEWTAGQFGGSFYRVFEDENLATSFRADLTLLQVEYTDEDIEELTGISPSPEEPMEPEI